MGEGAVEHFDIVHVLHDHFVGTLSFGRFEEAFPFQSECLPIFIECIPELVVLSSPRAAWSFYLLGADGAARWLHVLTVLPVERAPLLWINR